MTASRVFAGGVTDPCPGDGQRGVERPRREVRQLRGHVVDADGVRQVAGGQPEQQPPVGHAQRVHPVGVRTARHRFVGGGVRPHGGEQGGPDRVGGRARRPEGRVGEVLPVLGVPQQVVAEGRAGAEHRQQPHRGAFVLDELREQRVAVLDPLGQVREIAHRLVGVRGGGDHVQELVRGGAEPVEHGGDPPGVLEPEPDQPTRGGADPPVRHRRATSGTRARHTAANPSASTRQVRRSRSPAAATSPT